MEYNNTEEYLAVWIIISAIIFAHLSCSAFDYDTENMNSEDIYSSLKGVTEAIQNFSVRSQEDMNEPVQRREGEEVSRADRRMLCVDV